MRTKKSGKVYDTFSPFVGLDPWVRKRFFLSQVNPVSALCGLRGEVLLAVVERE